MNLKKLTSEKLIAVDCNFTTKKEVLDFLVEKLYSENKINSKEEFLKAVLERELLSETGISDGIAIPHGKSDAVKEACFAIARVKESIEDWKSIDEGNQVSLIFLLAIPDAQKGDTHLELLAELMTRISDKEFLHALKTAETAEILYEQLGECKLSKKKTERSDAKIVLVVTACPAGIAHTYLAAEALVKAGKELGIQVYVEKQGAKGIEDKHTLWQLEHAEAVIFAADVAVKNAGRYKHLPVYQTTAAAPMKNAKGVILTALEKKKKTESVETSTMFEVKKAVLTGISHIVPVIVAGGMVNAFAMLMIQGFGLQELAATEQSWLWCFKQLGNGMLGTLMLPLLSAYMAYSLGEKTALAPGFAAGLAASIINGGFLCAMLGGLAAGYTVRFLRKHIPAQGPLAGFISFWLYPVFSTVIVGILMFLVIGKPIVFLNGKLIELLILMSDSNGMILGAIIGAMVSFDLGGSVNKAAYTFCITAMSEGILMPYAAFASAKMVSGFAVTAATKLFKNLFTNEEKEIGNSTWIMVLAGITEGTIPIMMADPVRVIVALCTGSAVTGAIIGSTGIGLDVPGAGIFSLFLLKNGLGGIGNAVIWFFAAVVGAAISMLLLVMFKKHTAKMQS